MSNVTDELRAKADAYREAVFSLTASRLERDEAKRDLKSVEATVFDNAVKMSIIDGKNAETREAQAQLAYKSSVTWQAASDRYLKAENEFANRQDELTVALMELRVAAILTNVEIAQTGASRLLSEVSLAGA